MKKFVVPLMCLLIVVTAVSAQALVKYQVRPIYDLGVTYPPSSGPIGFTYSINDAGQVAGNTTINYNTQMPFIWQNGILNEIPAIPGGISSQTVGINNKGEVLLKGYTSGYVSVGSLWANNMHTLLGDLPGGSTYTAPAALNDAVSTQVVGTSSSTLGYEGFLWQDNIMSGLGMMPFPISTTTIVTDINDLGMTVGYGYPGGAFLRTSAGIVTILNSPPNYQNCQAWAVNNVGWVVGHCQQLTTYKSAAVLWRNQIPELLPMPPGATNSWACDINDFGLVAGQAVYADWNDSRGIQWGVVWNPVTVTDLNTVLDSMGGLNTTTTIQHVRSINNSGLMVGYGKDLVTTRFMSYLLMPYSTTAHLAATPTSLTFSAASDIDPASQTLLISNTLGSPMNWTINSSAPWLTVEPTSGSGISAALSVSASVTGLVPGTYLGNLTISSDQADNSPLSVLVTLIVEGAPPPHIVINPLSFSFSSIYGTGNPAPQTLSLSNSGAGILFWTIASNQTWLTATPATGNGAGTASISVNTAGLAAGTYSSTITITDPSADNSPQAVGVTLTILPRPSISFSPSSFNFSAEEGGTNPPPQAITIFNSAGGILNWTLSDNVPWLDEVPVSGTNTGTSTLSVTIAGRTAGIYLGTITITDPNASNSPSTANVTLTIRQKPGIAFSPASFAFTAPQGGAKPATQILSIANSGAGTLTWSLSVNQPWLSVAPATGTNNGTSTLSVNSTGLVAGTYTAAISIADPAAGNSPQTVPVTLTITAGGPYVRADLTALYAQGLVGGQSTSMPTVFKVWNAGTGTLNWTATTSASWITVKPSRGSSTGPSNTTTVTLTVSWAGKPAGTYTGSVTIKNGAKASDILVIPVTLTLTDAVKVTAPNGGEYLKSNTNFDISWRSDADLSFNTDHTGIFYSTNGGTTWVSVASLAGNPGSYHWLVPVLQKASSKCKVKVVLYGQYGLSLGEDISDATFTISK